MSWSTRRRWPSCRSPRRFDRRFQRQRPDASSTTRDLHNKLVLECRSEDNSAADFGCGAPLKNDGPPFTEESIQMAKRKANAAFMKPVQPDDKLAEVVGSKPLPRTELTKKLWAYIKKNGRGIARAFIWQSSSRTIGSGTTACTWNWRGVPTPYAGNAFVLVSTSFRTRRPASQTAAADSPRAAPSQSATRFASIEV